eukprot:m.37862 g.37862  ORF g.37862 m.37862 type:complete len:89 (-) comp10140_c0_seq2:172-438(-)
MYVSKAMEAQHQHSAEYIVERQRLIECITQDASDIQAKLKTLNVNLKALGSEDTSSLDQFEMAWTQFITSLEPTAASGRMSDTQMEAS